MTIFLIFFNLLLSRKPTKIYFTGHTNPMLMLGYLHFILQEPRRMPQLVMGFFSLWILIWLKFFSNDHNYLIKLISQSLYKYFYFNHLWIQVVEEGLIRLSLLNDLLKREIEKLFYSDDLIERNIKKRLLYFC